MHKCKSVDYTEQRKSVAKLYYLVITHKLIVREALKAFPQDCDDVTIKTAWYALCYLEADEERRAKDEIYRKEQDEYINFIWQTLEKGEELPSNIVKSYQPYHSDMQNAHSKTFKGLIKELCKFLCC